MMKKYGFMSLFTLFFTASSFSYATGMIPESSIVIVDQGDGEGAINVKNSDQVPMLLITQLENMPGDNESLLTITPPAARVEPGQSQRVRFIMTNSEVLKTEKMQRVIFEGVPPQRKDNSEVRLTVRQNLPVIIRPAGLPKSYSPWEKLSWTISENTLKVSNNSPYVVRLSQAVQTLPDNKGWILPQPYVLPGEQISATPKDDHKQGIASQVRINPATTWGFAVKSYDAPLAQ